MSKTLACPGPHPTSSPGPSSRSGSRSSSKTASRHGGAWSVDLSRKTLRVLSSLTGPLLAATLILGGCSGPGPGPDDDQSTTPPTPEASPAVSPADSPSPTPAHTGDPSPTPTEAPSSPTPAPTPTPTPPPLHGELSAPVEVFFDSTGAPHIYASNDNDVFFSQGYMAARDRLWQLELTRHQAMGRNTEIWGPGSIGQDMVVRGFKPIEHAQAELERWKTAYPRQYTWLEAYAAGVNAYIDDAQASRNGATLPPEYAAVGITPTPLTLVELGAMDYLFAYSEQGDPFIELTATLIKLVVGENIFQDFLRLHPIEDQYSVPDALTPLNSPPDATDTGSSGDGSSSATAYDPELQRYLDHVLADPENLEKVKKAISTLPRFGLWDHFLGSNGWAVDAAHSSTGGALLAGDTHMGISLPNTFHQVHINTADSGGDLDAMGVTAAGGPGLIIGHTRYVGWTLTTSMVDANDLYLERPAPSDPTGSVLFKGKAVPYETWQETFRVRQNDGSFTNEVRTLKVVPQHGQVMPPEATGLPEELIITLKWAGEQPGTVTGTLGSFLMARDMDDMEASMADHRIGCNNYVMATIDGDIAVDARVWLPMREAYDAANPPWLALPGSGGYEWTGDYIPAEAMPHVVDPPAGFVVSANNDAYGNTKDGDPLNDEYYVGAMYDSGMRAKRLDNWIRERLEQGLKISPADMETLQADVTSMLAGRLVPILLDAGSRRSDLVTPEMASALDLLERWDLRMAGDSPAPPIFLGWWTAALQTVFVDELDPSILSDYSGDTAQYYARPLVYFLEATADQIDEIDAGTADFPSLSGMNYFDNQDTADKVETRDEDLLEALSIAVTHVIAVQGSDMSTWRWDAMHTLTLNNTSRWFLPDGTTRGPYPMEGDSYSVDVAEGTYYSGGQAPDNYGVGKVPSIRMVLDFSGGTVKAVNIMPGGQSEDPNSPHYNDQTDTWLANQNRALPFTRDEVEADAEARWTLPAGFPNAAPVKELR